MTAQQLKNAILQEAIEGRLVPQDPNDEPASILLEKIRKEKERLVKEGKLKKKDLEVKPISEDEIPFNIPKSWEWVRFSQLYWQLTDGTHSTPKYKEEGIPFLSVKDMSSGKISFSNTKYISAEEHSLLSQRCHPQKGDLLLSKVGTTGIPLIIDTDREFSIFVSLALIKYFPNLIDSNFLLYIINSPLVQLQVKDNTRGVGNKNWVLSAISNTIMVLPPLVEQKRIVAKIEELLPKVEKYGKAQDELNKLNEELPERLKKSILQEAIEGRLVPQDPNDEPASVLLQKIREEKQKLVKEGKLKKKDLEEKPISEDEIPFEIPESWEWVRLGALISYQNGYAYNSSEMNKVGKGIPVIKSGNLMTLEVVLKRNNDYVEHPNNKMLASKIVKGDMLMCLSSQSDNPEPLGKTAIYKFDTFALLNQRVLKFRPYIDELTTLLFYTINSFYFWYNVSHQGGGSAQANLKLNHVLDMPVPLPPLAEQHRIVEKIEQLFKEIDKLKTK